MEKNLEYHNHYASDITSLKNELKQKNCGNLHVFSGKIPAVVIVNQISIDQYYFSASPIILVCYELLLTESIKIVSKWQAGYVFLIPDFHKKESYIKQFFIDTDKCIINPAEF